ncbi:Programmed cell death 4 [Gossypium australe]|uniref:Programmed cell death 4 n=1 Tax=Gossypium australe TaxID=47621 RepID=A0A5B6WT99_9ROSI|nr:Programmed cell death 4 [Gossypium australe]
MKFEQIERRVNRCNSFRFNRLNPKHFLRSPSIHNGTSTLMVGYALKLGRNKWKVVSKIG